MKEKVFCAFCKLPQKVYKRRHVHPVELVGLAIAGGITSYLIWEDLHWSGLFLFAMFAVISELGYQARWKLSIKCRSCGFDPLLYKRNPELAAGEVKVFLANRKQDPLYLLRSQPKIEPIYKKVKNFKWKEPTSHL